MKSISVTCTKCNHREEVTVNDETIWTEEVKNKHVCFLCGHTKKGGTSSIIGKRKIVKENKSMPIIEELLLGGNTREEIANRVATKLNMTVKGAFRKVKRVIRKITQGKSAKWKKYLIIAYKGEEGIKIKEV